MIVIGEKINATMPRVRKAISGRNKATLAGLAREQEKAGADCIDVNVGTGEGDGKAEIENMQWLVNVVKDSVGCSLCIDSADAGVLKAGLLAGMDRAGFVNSVKADEEAMEDILPFVAGRDVNVVGLAIDENGIPGDADGRLRACELIAEGAVRHGIPLEKIYFDPVCMPVGTDASQGKVTIDTLVGIKKYFPAAKTILAVSNVSHGLPHRSWLNRAMVQAALAHGVDALLMDPLDRPLVGAIRAANVVMGRDRHCRKFLRAARQGLFEAGEGKQ